MNDVSYEEFQRRETFAIDIRTQYPCLPPRVIEFLSREFHNWQEFYGFLKNSDTLTEQEAFSQLGRLGQLASFKGAKRLANYFAQALDMPLGQLFPPEQFDNENASLKTIPVAVSVSPAPARPVAPVTPVSVHPALLTLIDHYDGDLGAVAALVTPDRIRISGETLKSYVEGRAAILEKGSYTVLALAVHHLVNYQLDQQGGKRVDMKTALRQSALTPAASLKATL